MVDAAVALEELGRAVNPAPFTTSAVGAASLVLLAGAEREQAFLLPGLADGTTIGALALYEPASRYSWSEPATTARRAADGWRIDGAKVHVADGARSTLLLVTARDDRGDVGVFAVETGSPGVAVEPIATVDGSRKVARATFSDADGWRLGAGDARAAQWPARSIVSTAAYVVDGVGAAARALELAVEYAKERVQFDQPIGAFQAIQHLCSDMLRTVELGRAAGYYACWAADDAPTEEASPRRDARRRVRERGVRAARRHRDPGVRRRSASRGSTTSTSSTSGCSRSRSPSAPATTTSPSSPPSSSTPDAGARRCQHSRIPHRASVRLAIRVASMRRRVAHRRRDDARVPSGYLLVGEATNRRQPRWPDHSRVSCHRTLAASRVRRPCPSTSMTQSFGQRTAKVATRTATAVDVRTQYSTRLIGVLQPHATFASALQHRPRTGSHGDRRRPGMSRSSRQCRSAAPARPRRARRRASRRTVASPVESVDGSSSGVEVDDCTPNAEQGADHEVVTGIAPTRRDVRRPTAARARVRWTISIAPAVAHVHRHSTSTTPSENASKR